MTSTFVRTVPPQFAQSHRTQDARLVELVMALSGCTAARALPLVRRQPGAAPLDRVAVALAVLRADVRAARN